MFLTVKVVRHWKGLLLSLVEDLSKLHVSIKDVSHSAGGLMQKVSQFCFIAHV